jgi:hypothetical protein
MWVPEDWVADVMKGLPDTQVEIVNPVEFRSQAARRLHRPACRRIDAGVAAQGS